LDGVLFDKNQTTLIQCPGGQPGRYAIPSSVTRLGEASFAGCVSLTGVSLGAQLSSIPVGGPGAFVLCRSLTAFAVDPGNPTFSSVDGVLFDKNLTTLIQYPGGKTGRYTIPDGTLTVGAGAFYLCAGVARVIVPESVTSIEEWAFANSTTRGVYFKGNAPRDRTGSSSPSFYYHLPEATGWGPWLGGSYTALWDVATGLGYTIEHDTIFIDGYAEDGPVDIPETLKDLPVVGIGGPAFEYCSSLTAVTIPKGVTHFAPTTFMRCTNLTAITVDAGNSTYSSMAGVLFNKAETTLIRYPGGRTGNYIMPKGVTTIGDGAFAGCPTLQTITISKTVTSIEAGAFDDCTNLREVYFECAPPTLGYLALGSSPAATFYHLPGTRCSGVTTAPWKPQMQANDASFGVQTNGFGFTLTWARDKVVVVQATRDLVTAAWTAVATNTLTDGSSYFSDPQWNNNPRRFYRLRSP
jgi:GH24 family phage-related lysozyme (muramidase)